MAKRKIIWSTDSSFDMVAIMQYYTNRNKSKRYSLKLYKEIQLTLKTLDFSIALPKKTSDKKLYYFTHNHIFVGFDIKDNNLIVQLIIDERRNPETVKRLLNTI